jgi:hypothetical protein
MTDNLENKPIQQRFQHLLDLISSERFLKMQGLGKEVPFFICPFRPEEALQMESIRKQLTNRLEQSGINILNIDLYDLSIELLQARGIWDRVLQMEESSTKNQLRELLQGVLDAESHLIPAISDKMAAAEFDVMFISGVGEVFPYIRSHTVLNNLQKTAKEKPTVMFFPGDYTHSLDQGASLDLFGRMLTDKYYRAFNIYHCQI